MIENFQKYLQLTAIKGYPENGGDRSRTDKIGSGTLSDLAKKIGWSEDKLSMANWLDKNAPEEIKEERRPDPFQSVRRSLLMLARSGGLYAI